MTRTEADPTPTQSTARQRAPEGPLPRPGAMPTLLAGAVDEDWTRDARFAEYTAAADPVSAGTTTPVPIRRFSPALHAGGGSRVVDLDCSEELRLPGPATTPALRASFVVLAAGTPVSFEPEATSELYYCLSGEGASSIVAGGTDAGAGHAGASASPRAVSWAAGAGHAGASASPRAVSWAAGDVFVLPAGSRSEHRAAGRRAVLYRVSDAPLLRYLGAVASEARFAPTRYPAAATDALLDEVARHPEAARRSRVSVLLGNAATPDTMTVTHVLWAMVGVLPAGSVQRPHRHQSVAVDLVTSAPAGCYTLLGERLDPLGRIVDPVRVDWESGGAFVTPPGLWHSHHNESEEPARLVPVQDAGLHTYLRSLDIRFARPDA